MPTKYAAVAYFRIVSHCARRAIEGKLRDHQEVQLLSKLAQAVMHLAGYSRVSGLRLDWTTGNPDQPMSCVSLYLQGDTKIIS